MFLSALLGSSYKLVFSASLKALGLSSLCKGSCKKKCVVTVAGEAEGSREDE